MKKALLKAFVIAAFALSVALPVLGQPPKVKDNFDQKLRKITLWYKTATSVDWEPTIDNYWVPVNARTLRFEIELSRPLASIRARLELRQLCQLGVNPDIEITREQEFFASNTPLGGTELTSQAGPTKIYNLLITVHPPEGGTAHPQPHCFENPDHLGEGPYEALLWLGSGTSILGTDDTVHLTYTKTFETKSTTEFNRLKNFLKFFDTRKRRRARNR
jgi:hypothetical protein